jgi:hypothetical protein
MSSKKPKKARRAITLSVTPGPKETQFPPGQSGNPAGRPRGRPSLDELLLEEAARIVKLQVGDKVTHMDRDRALMRKLFDMALQGKVPAIQLVLARLAQTALNDKAEPQAIDKARGAGSAIATLPSARSNAPSPRPRRSSASASICPSARRGSRPSRRRSRASRCPNTSIRSIRWFSFSTCSTIAIAGRSIVGGG